MKCVYGYYFVMIYKNNNNIKATYDCSNFLPDLVGSFVRILFSISSSISFHIFFKTKLLRGCTQILKGVRKAVSYVLFFLLRGGWADIFSFHISAFPCRVD